MSIVAEKGLSQLPDDQKLVKEAIQNKIETNDLAYWQDFFAQLDLCVEPVLSLAEALNSELAVEREWVVDVPLSKNDTALERQLANPIQFSRSKMRYDYIGQALGVGEW